MPARRPTGRHFSALFLLLFAAGQALADVPKGFAKPGSAPAYDEVRTSSGEVRPQYIRSVERLEAITPPVLDEFLARSGYPKINPRPRILTRDEYRAAREGVAQRGRAFLEFLKEAATGGTSFIQGESEHGFIPADAWKRIVARTRFKADPALDPAGLGFYYGADLVRGPDGSFRVVEDNFSNPGGLADIRKTRESFLAAFPAFQSFLPRRPDPDDVQASIAVFAGQLKGADQSSGHTTRFILSTDSWMFTEHGIDVRAWGAIHLMGDKEFYLYVPAMIRRYLGQEPAIPNIPAVTVEDFKAEFGRYPIAEDLKDMVLKVADGLGGNGIYVGPKISETELAKGEAALKREPARYLLQEFVSMSHANDRILDYRLHSLISTSGTWVSPIPITRENPASGDGRVNIHQGGSLAPVFVFDCTEGLRVREPSIPAPAVNKPAPVARQRLVDRFLRWWRKP